MKRIIQKTTGFLAAAAMLFSFTACEQTEVTPDASLEASNAQNAHRSKSYNLNKTYTAEIKALNGSGVMGTATLMLEGNMLTVNIMASGLEAGMLHVQHIHGFMDKNKNAVCPPMSADTNGNGLVELGEGLPFYGPILLDLAPFSTAPDGSINYTQTFQVSAGVLPLQNNVIVLHGMTVDGVYWPSLPVACGEIKVMNNGNR
ncbi:hypothetical protein H9Q13_08510 [Pontibacter sp. JH31]|uniref:CHRD domain-containing protein n=1 Tax=Pontibacter aquaedesilientis TaxID=2766980 RepID=A0ABR7XFX4_9BACT|nr:hypothetical protein [Pontibacter aquaedesilientis]MBD1397203.1 hypothetical protein [Pontibacter aquaedesilientis]